MLGQVRFLFSTSALDLIQGLVVGMPVGLVEIDVFVQPYADLQESVKRSWFLPLTTDVS